MGFNSLPALKLGKKPFDDFKESFPGMNLTHILLFLKCLLIKPRCSICSVFNKVIPPPSNVDSVVRFPKISLSLLYCQYVKRYCNFIPPPLFLFRNDSVEHSGQASHCHKSENLKG